VGGIGGLAAEPVADRGELGQPLPVGGGLGERERPGLPRLGRPDRVRLEQQLIAGRLLPRRLDRPGRQRVPPELAEVASAVGADGVGRVVLLGASKGAKASLVAARQLGPAVAGVVSLSAEAGLAPDIDVASASAGITVPVLLVTADQDRYGSAEALDGIRRGLANAEVLRVPGAAHGTLLLDDGPWRRGSCHS
jgi:pimeloyl-ACP methyl ester carboxylesterase